LRQKKEKIVLNAGFAKKPLSALIKTHILLIKKMNLKYPEGEKFRQKIKTQIPISLKPYHAAPRQPHYIVTLKKC